MMHLSGRDVRELFLVEDTSCASQLSSNFGSDDGISHAVVDDHGASLSYVEFFQYSCSVAIITSPASALLR
jgi:hypothetical protein